jgi:dsDNA-specific endonuclease/ATPase MutS2
MDEEFHDDQACHELVIDGTLDLHMFRPRDVKDLVPDYLEACREKGILWVRIVHGKGTGALRRTVHSILEKIPEVVTYRLGREMEGGWGATVVELKPLDENTQQGI